MSSSKIIFAILALIACTVFAAAPEDSTPGVTDLTPSNVNTILDGSKYVFVEFYAPWCGHCKNLAPEYAKVGEAIEKFKPKDVVVAKVNCDEHKDICGKYEVRGYPTLKFFGKNAAPEDYQKGRSAEDIIEFLNDRTGAGLRVDKPPSFVTVLTPTNFDKIALDPSKNVLVEFYAPWCGHCKRLEPDYEKVGKAFRLQKDVVVAKVDADKHRELGERYGVQGFPTIKFFPAGSDKKGEDYQRGRSVEDFIQFLNEKANAHRTAEGTLDDNAGRVSALDAIAAKFVKASADEKAKLVSEAETLAGDAKTEAADYYVRVMKKLQETSDFAEKEAARLKRVLDSGSVSEDRLDNMKTRLNVLTAFK
jgi:protein disulfide-isomerase A6